MPDFDRIKLKFGLGLDLGALISNLTENVDKASSFDEKRTIPLFLVKYSLKDGHHSNKERSLRELLVLINSVYTVNETPIQILQKPIFKFGHVTTFFGSPNATWLITVERNRSCDAISFAKLLSESSNAHA